jgi:exopolysaccharide biosynthesis polyprenyl glycosylphosphotransferase
LSQLESASVLSLPQRSGGDEGASSDFLVEDRIRRVSAYEVVLKRTFDLISVAVIFALFWWAMLLIVVAVKLSSPGPVVFGHRRVGRLGKSFRCYKFRSMVPNAEAVLKELLDRDPAARAEWNRDFKLKNDPRITRIGAFIRKTSLDELPQLWNVLKGEMSMVGPRPERPVFIEQLEQQVPFFKQRLYVKPGVTGHAQVRCRYGASAEDMLEKLQYDLYYIKSYSVLFDLGIILDTVKVVLLRIGAR